MRRLAEVAFVAGVLALQYAVGVAYSSRGTWWHWLLHQLVGWGVGLAVVALLAAWRRVLVPWVPAALGGQLVSIVPDLMFRYGRMPHEASMDLWLGHISIHRGPSPVVVALLVFLLGSSAWLAAVRSGRASVALAAASLLLLAGACVAAEPLPSRLADFPRDSAPVRT